MLIRADKTQSKLIISHNKTYEVLLCTDNITPQPYNIQSPNIIY